MVPDLCCLEMNLMKLKDKGPNIVQNHRNIIIGGFSLVEEVSLFQFPGKLAKLSSFLSDSHDSYLVN